MRRSRDQHLAAEMPALLLRGELVLEVDARCAGLDIGLHDLERVERAAEPGLGIGHDRGEPVAARAAFRMLDLVGALERPVDAARELRPGIGGIKGLVGVHGARDVRIGGNLPSREIDRLEPGPDHLHGLVPGDGSERVDVGTVLQEVPKPVGAPFGERIGDRHGAAQPGHIGGRIGTDDPVEPARGG